MTTGTVIINGPIGNMNGALDYDGAFTMTGGYLIAAGSIGMAQAPTTSSTQYSVMLSFPSMLAAYTMVHIESSYGEEILTFVPTKSYQSLAKLRLKPTRLGELRDACYWMLDAG
ncbi:MAG: hypothetical protein ACMUIP_15380 [bacterium]